MNGVGRIGSWLRSVLFFSLGCLAVLVVLEGIASLLLFFLALPEALEPTIAERLHTRYDAELGWVNVPGTRIEDLYGPGATLTINGQGFRAPYDYTPRPPAGQIRLICSGDSFTLGFGVNDGDTWCARLEARDERFEAVNMGQGGYGIDQSYLWFQRDGVALEHDVHLFAFIRDDFGRARASEFIHYGKPVLAVENDRLVVRNVPVPQAAYRFPWLSQNAQLLSELRSVQLLRPGLRVLSSQPVAELSMSELEELALHIFEDLAEQHAEQGRALLLVHLPQLDDYRKPDEPWLRRIRQRSRQRGLQFVDLVRELDRLPPTEAAALYISEASVDFPWAAGHLSEAGNEWVANQLYQRILARVEVQEALALPQGRP